MGEAAGPLGHFGQLLFLHDLLFGKVSADLVVHLLQGHSWVFRNFYENIFFTGVVDAEVPVGAFSQAIGWNLVILSRIWSWKRLLIRRVLENWVWLICVVIERCLRVIGDILELLPLIFLLLVFLLIEFLLRSSKLTVSKILIIGKDLLILIIFPAQRMLLKLRIERLRYWLLLHQLWHLHEWRDWWLAFLLVPILKLHHWLHLAHLS